MTSPVRNVKQSGDSDYLKQSGQVNKLYAVIGIQIPLVDIYQSGQCFRRKANQEKGQT